MKEKCFSIGNCGSLGFGARCTAARAAMAFAAAIAFAGVLALAGCYTTTNYLGIVTPHNAIEVNSDNVRVFEAPTYDEAVVKAGETGFEVILSYEGRNTQVAFWSVLYPPVGKVRVIAKDADGIRPATVNDMDLTALVPKPLTGADKVTAFQSQEQYTGTVIWKVYTDTNNFWAPFTMTKFAANKVYQAVVTLKPKTSLFSFKGVAKNSFKHTQADSVTNDANSGVVTITFPATAALQPDTGAAQ